MSLDALLAQGTHPDSAVVLSGVSSRWRQLFGTGPDAATDLGALIEQVVRKVETGGLEDQDRLAIAADIAELMKLRGERLDDEVAARLDATSRGILTGIADSLRIEPRRLPRSRLRRAHVLMVGDLAEPEDLPSEGAIGYASALAQDASVDRIEIVHSGTISPKMRAWIQARLGALPPSRGVALVSTRDNPDFLADIFNRGPATYHIWGEPALSPVIGLLSRLGPTVLYSEGDAPPVQFADVYWGFESQEAIGQRWAARRTPGGFIERYVELSAGPFLQLPAPAHLSRSELGVPQDALVIATVSEGLKADMAEDYVTGIELAIRDRPDCVWMVAGRLPDYLESAFSQVLGARFIYQPAHPDLERLMTAVDIFANPFRPTGGREANLAASAGAAVLSLANSEAASVAVPALKAFDVDDYLFRLGVLLADRDLLASCRAEQVAQLHSRRDSKTFLKDVRMMVRRAVDSYEARGFGAPLSETVVVQPGS